MTDSRTMFYLGAVVVAVLAALVWALISSRRRNMRPQLANPYIEGLQLLIDGRTNEAFNRLQQAVKTGFAPNDAYIRLGAMLRERGEPSKALQIHKSLTVKTDLSNDEKIALFCNIAEDYGAMGSNEKAVAVLETALRKNGHRNPLMYKLLVAASHRLGQTEVAYSHLKELKKLGEVDNRELALYLAAAAEAIAEDSRAARKLLQRALKYDPHCAPALLVLGDIEEKDGNPRAAGERWRAAARFSEALAPTALVRLERVLFQQGTFGEIEAIYRDVLAARPDDEQATRSLAAFYRKQGRADDAIGLLEDYRSQFGGNRGVDLLLMSLYATERDGDALEEFIDSVVDEMAPKVAYVCRECGFKSRLMRWCCPECSQFDSFHENA